MADLQSATYNGFEATTTLAAQLPNPPNNTNFDGDYIVKVQPLGVNSDGLTPRQQLHGILGQGCDAGYPQAGGVGVTGFGSPSQGTGVLGQGGVSYTFDNNQSEPGAGGIGVSGVGGDGLSTLAEAVQPGTGVLGQGGLPASGQGAGAGVVGLAGGIPIPLIQHTAGVGVFGQGPSVGISGLSPTGVAGVNGASDSGKGVSGTSDSGDGVSGTSGSGAGVDGTSISGAGVSGTSTTNRGGIFASARAHKLG